jgi:glycosyltransferase involved in cell wall biosynthesis
MKPDVPGVALSGGVVAFNERRRIREAILSLTRQSLPPGATWRELVVVVSGSTDGTPEVVEKLAREDSRVRPVIEPERCGKAAALAHLFELVRGDQLVLLNGDAIAEDGAVAALLAAAAGRTGPYAVMGRPRPMPAGPGTFGRAVELLWAVHHSDHQRALAARTGNHLSDELLLLPTDHLPPIPSGIVNDGSFIGGWLATSGGQLLYAPDATVRITAPAGIREHIRQRRRILFGHRQVRERSNVEPTTLGGYARRHPVGAMRLVAQETRRPGGVSALVTLGAAELVALGLAAVDRRSNGPDHVRWRSIVGVSPDTAAGDAGGAWPSDRA